MKDSYSVHLSVLEINMERQNIKLRTLFLIAFLTMTFAPDTVRGVHAFHAGERVTPYGDYCNRVSHYGMHHKALSNEQVHDALKHYYTEKDLDYEIINSKGRFVKALIKDGNITVDVIIFDRHTGRIRSVY